MYYLGKVLGVLHPAGCRQTGLVLALPLCSRPRTVRPSLRVSKIPAPHLVVVAQINQLVWPAIAIGGLSALRDMM